MDDGTELGFGFLQRPFDAPALGNLLGQLAVHQAQLDVTAFEFGVEQMQLEIRLTEATVRGLERRERFQKENFRRAEGRSFVFRPARGPEAEGQGVLMDARHVQHAQTTRNGFAAEFVGRFQKRFLLPVRVTAERGDVLP